MSFPLLKQQVAFKNLSRSVSLSLPLSQRKVRHDIMFLNLPYLTYQIMIIGSQVFFTEDYQFY